MLIYKEPVKNHGIIFLENRSQKIFVEKSNKNDVIKIFGQPHTKSLNDDDLWIYIERVLTKGEYHKLGQNVLKANTNKLDVNDGLKEPLPTSENLIFMISPTIFHNFAVFRGG